MLIGNAPCSWGVYYPTGDPITPEAYLDQVAAAGYRGTELGPFGFLPNDPARARRALAAPRPDADRRRPRPHLRRPRHRRRRSCRRCASSAPSSGPGRPPDRHHGRERLVPARRARACSTPPAGPHGRAPRRGRTRDRRRVRRGASFHPHVGTAVELEAQIDRLLADTEVDLCFDTGHHAFWGQDPLAYMDRVWGRIAYMHLKNVDPAVRARVLDGSLGRRPSPRA